MTATVGSLPGELSSRDDLTLAALWAFLSSGTWEESQFVDWPPDVFAITAATLELSGAHGFALTSAADGFEQARRCGEEWSRSLASGAPPTTVRDAWGTLRAAAKTTLIEQLYSNSSGSDIVPILRSLILLTIAADEACEGVSSPSPDSPRLSQLHMRLVSSRDRTLCRNVSPSRAAVLPKGHTPSVGITIRSLSRNLAFINTTEVVVRSHLAVSAPVKPDLNIVLVPWPFEIDRSWFAFRRNPSTDGHQVLFNYEPEHKAHEARDAISAALAACKKNGVKPDLVILPELALSKVEYDECRQLVVEEHNCFFLTGMRNQVRTGDGVMRSVNCAVLDPPTAVMERRSFVQHKHHRWRLDPSQISNYELPLEAAISGKDAWEDTLPRRRHIEVAPLIAGVSGCVLLCEDLARQDPAAPLVRALAPNLVVALLLDGPQFEQRWSGRYASALAEDPGSSVLTLTSLGMVRLDRRSTQASPLVGLWKERDKPVVNISMGPRDSCVVLKAAKGTRQERTIDGREGTREFLTLTSSPCPLRLA